MAGVRGLNQGWMAAELAGVLMVGAYMHSCEGWRSLEQYLQRAMGLARPVNVSLYRVKSITPHSSDFEMAAFLR